MGKKLYENLLRKSILFTVILLLPLNIVIPVYAQEIKNAETNNSNPRLEIRDIEKLYEGNKISIQFVLENKGSSLLQPKGKLDITNTLNNHKETFPLDTLGTLIPGRPSNYHVQTTIKRPILGDYEAVVRLDYGPNHSLSQKYRFQAYDAQMLGMILALLIVFVLLVYFTGLYRSSRSKALLDEPHSASEPRSFLYRESDSIELPQESLPVATDQKSASQTKSSSSKSGNKRINKLEYKKIVFPAIPLLLGFSLGYLFLSGFYSGGKALKTDNTAVAVPTPISKHIVASPTIAPTNNIIAPPTQVPLQTPETVHEVDKSSINIHVLNGTKENGLAARYASRLKASGFNVVKVGNADRNTYTESIVRYPKMETGKVDLLVEEMRKYDVNVNLDESESPVFILILGKS
jgi:hypothetical protein